MTMQTLISSPGKVILFGEHAVVYGKSAIAASLGLRTYVKAKDDTESPTLVVSFPDVDFKADFTLKNMMQDNKMFRNGDVSPEALNKDLLSSLKKFAQLPEDSDNPKHLALASLLYLYFCIHTSYGLPPLQIEVRSRIPIGAGLGSSAAFSTSLAASFLIRTNQLMPLQTSELSPRNNVNTRTFTAEDLALINKWALQCERIMHGNPSGIDNSVSTYGEAILFQKAKISFLSCLPQFRIILFNTKQPRSTKQLVENVRIKYNLYPDIIRPVLDSIEGVTTACIACCQQETSVDQKLATMCDLVAMNQQLLEVLGVSHAKIQQLCSIVAKHGLAAKLTGAGGGGCVFAIVPTAFTEDALESCMQEARENKFEAWLTSIGGDGVSHHQCNDFFDTL